LLRLAVVEEEQGWHHLILLMAVLAAVGTIVMASKLEAQDCNQQALRVVSEVMVGRLLAMGAQVVAEPERLAALMREG
jgi:hypothetical protein